MNNMEIVLYLGSWYMMLSIDKEQNAQELEQISKELAALQRQADSNTRFSEKPETEKTTVIYGFVKFTNKEILQMPIKFRKVFRLAGCLVQAYKRTSGKRNINYELRYRRDGYDIYASSNNIDEAKEKFIKRVREADAYGDVKTPAIPSAFDGYSDYYFENFYKRKVVTETLRVALNQYKNHLNPHFGNIELKRITPKMCQELLDRLEKQGKGKTADDVHSLMNMIFKAAVKHSVIHNNPLDMVFHTQHERKHGSSLTKEEEAVLLSMTEKTPLQLMFAVALYTGLRPNEYETARLEGNFIIAVNSKRKNGKTQYKRIPVTPMLKPYLKGMEKIEFYSLRIMRDRFNKIFQNHKLYDLRTTFYTRCKECGVADVAINEFMGHSQGGLAETYTDLSDEFLIAEGNKLDY